MFQILKVKYSILAIPLNIWPSCSTGKKINTYVIKRANHKNYNYYGRPKLNDSSLIQ